MDIHEKYIKYEESHGFYDYDFKKEKSDLDIISQELIEAAESDDINRVKSLIKSGADVDYGQFLFSDMTLESYSALEVAIENDNIELVELLLKNRATVHTTTDLIDEFNHFKADFLHGRSIESIRCDDHLLVSSDNDNIKYLLIKYFNFGADLDEFDIREIIDTYDEYGIEYESILKKVLLEQRNKKIETEIDSDIGL